jgi:hypothetical protein
MQKIHPRYVLKVAGVIDSAPVRGRFLPDRRATRATDARFLCSRGRCILRCEWQGPRYAHASMSIPDLEDRQLGIHTGCGADSTRYYEIEPRFTR